MRTFREPGQGALFDARQYDRPTDQGEKDIDDWLEQNGIHYHGTFRQDWESAPSAHMGTQSAAMERLNQVHTTLRNSPSARDKYFDPASSESGELNWEAQEYTGRLHARRLDTEPERINSGSSGSYPDTVRASADANANAADVYHWAKEGHDEWEIPGSLKESAVSNGRISHYVGPDLSMDWGDEPRPGRMTSEALRGTDLLQQGKAISYENAVEGGTSLVVPRSMPKMTWEQDILASPNASTGRKQYAMQRREQGTEGTIAFDAPPDKGPAVQRTFGGGLDPMPSAKSRRTEFRFTADGYNNIT